MGKDGKSWTTLVGKDGEKSSITKIGHPESFWTTLFGKDGKKCEMTKIVNIVRSFYWYTLHRFLVPGYPGTEFPC